MTKRRETQRDVLGLKRKLFKTWLFLLIGYVWAVAFFVVPPVLVHLTELELRIDDFEYHFCYHENESYVTFYGCAYLQNTGHLDVRIPDDCVAGHDEWADEMISIEENMTVAANLTKVQMPDDAECSYYRGCLTYCETHGPSVRGDLLTCGEEILAAGLYSTYWLPNQNMTALPDGHYSFIPKMKKYLDISIGVVIQAEDGQVTVTNQTTDVEGSLEFQEFQDLTWVINLVVVPVVLFWCFLRLKSVFPNLNDEFEPRR